MKWSSTYNSCKYSYVLCKLWVLAIRLSLINYLVRGVCLVHPIVILYPLISVLYMVLYWNSFLIYWYKLPFKICLKSQYQNVLVYKLEINSNISNIYQLQLRPTCPQDVHYDTRCRCRPYQAGNVKSSMGYNQIVFFINFK